jgi:heme/copper-type cytochrome/quinol oxidase subunit 2
MAQTLFARGLNVKVRGPWVVFLLAIVTFGVYYFVWYYRINRELRDYGRAMGAAGLGNSPFVSLLAVTVGWILLVPPFVSMFRTFERIATAQQVAGIGREASPLLGILLYLLAFHFLPVELPYAQIELNKIWQRLP